MKRFAGLRNHLRALSSTVFPSLRVIGMAYTGLIGVGAAALVVSVAFLPVAPVLQQATQPAREAVGIFVQPATDVVTNLIIASATVPRDPFLLFVQPPLPAVASAPIVEDDVPEDAAPPSAEVSQPVAARLAMAPHLTLAPVAKANVSRSTDAETSDPVAEDVPADEPQQAVETRDRAPVREVAVALAAPVQQEANVEAPRPLPPQPAPTEAAWQTKARLDVENQAAIDATKASIVRRKAEADTANQAAIDVRKTSTVSFVAVPTPTVTVEAARPVPAVLQPTTPAAAVVVPTPTPQTLVSANASNQTLIDAALAAKLRAKADANAANQAAMDAAKTPRSTVKPVPSPTLPPAPAAPTSAPTAEPTPTRTPVKAADPVNVAILDDQPIDLEEMPAMVALDKASDVSR